MTDDADQCLPRFSNDKRAREIFHVNAHDLAMQPDFFSNLLILRCCALRFFKSRLLDIIDIIPRLIFRGP